MRRKEWKILHLIFYLIFIIIFLNVKVYAFHEIREGEEKAFYSIYNTFDLIPQNVSFCNYKEYFNYFDDGKLGIEVDVEYKKYDDCNIPISYVSNVEKFTKNTKQYKNIDNYFENNIFNVDDTFLQRVFKIYQWINENIQYKISWDRDETAKSVFIKREADCLGYSKLMVYLLRKSYIPSLIYYSYLYGKKALKKYNNSAIFHAVIAIYHPLYGWIAMEPQGMFLTITANHLLLFPLDQVPNKVIHYRENEYGEKFFHSKRDETAYKISIFIDKFGEKIKNSQLEYKKDYKIIGIVNLMNKKGIASENSLFNNKMLSKISFISERQINKINIFDINKQGLFTINFIQKNKILLLHSNSLILYTLFDGENYQIFGLPKGNFALFLMYQNLPFKIIKIENYGSDFYDEIIDNNYLLKKGDFNMAQIIFPDGKSVFLHKDKGFIYIPRLNIDKIPIFLDFNNKYFYVFGMKKGEYTIKLFGKNNYTIRF